MQQAAETAWKAGNMPQEITRSEVLEIQRVGYRAYLAGQSPKDNPHKRESEESTQRQEAWFRGYAASKTDRARANRQAQDDEK